MLRAADRPGANVEDLEPAERAGFVLLTGESLRFRHPLVRYAAYQGAPLARRIAAHRALAAALVEAGQAHRRAWHLAAASTGPDESVAEELERVAEWADSRQAMASASAAYERAARLTSDPQLRSRRPVLAAQRAADAGQDERCDALADQVEQPLADPGVAAAFARARAVVALGYRSPRNAARILLSSAKSTGVQRPDMAASLLTDAVHAAFCAGDVVLIREIALHAPAMPVLSVPAQLFGGDVAGGVEALRALREQPDLGVMGLLMIGIYCQLTGDHAAARRAASSAVAHCRDHGQEGMRNAQSTWRPGERVPWPESADSPGPGSKQVTPHAPRGVGSPESLEGGEHGKRSPGLWPPPGRPV